MFRCHNCGHVAAATRALLRRLVRCLRFHFDVCIAQVPVHHVALEYLLLVRPSNFDPFHISEGCDLADCTLRTLSMSQIFLCNPASGFHFDAHTVRYQSARRFGVPFTGPSFHYRPFSHHRGLRSCRLHIPTSLNVSRFTMQPGSSLQLRVGPQRR